MHRTDTVDEQPDLHAGACAFDHALHRLATECVVAENIGADVQALGRVRHGGEQGGGGFAAVAVQVNRGGRGRCQSEAFDESFGPVLVVRASSGPVQQLARQFAAAEHEIRGQGDIGHRHHAENPGDGDRRRPTFAFHACGQDVDEHADGNDQRMQGDSRKPGVHQPVLARGSSCRSTAGTRSGRSSAMQAGTKAGGRRAMHPDAGGGGQEGIHALREQA